MSQYVTVSRDARLKTVAFAGAVAANPANRAAVRQGENELHLNPQYDGAAAPRKLSANCFPFLFSSVFLLPQWLVQLSRILLLFRK